MPRHRSKATGEFTQAQTCTALCVIDFISQEYRIFKMSFQKTEGSNGIKWQFETILHYSRRTLIYQCPFGFVEMGLINLAQQEFGTKQVSALRHPPPPIWVHSQNICPQNRCEVPLRRAIQEQEHSTILACCKVLLSSETGESRVSPECTHGSQRTSEVSLNVYLLANKNAWLDSWCRTKKKRKERKLAFFSP